MSDAYKGASREALEQLHRALVDVMLKTFAECDAEGRVPCALFLGVVRKFLKDNKATGDLAGARDLRRSLEELRGLSLPFTDTTKKDTKQ